MTPPRHEMVRASAGSGKTRELALRFVRLLLLGDDPSRIAALTFTRKAAGEFLDRIIAVLCDLAENPASAAALFPGAPPGSVTSASALAALERLARAAGRLRLGTIDSFFLRMARAFALELGLPGTIHILQGAAENTARQRVLRRLLAEKEKVATALIEAFDLWSHGEARLNIAAEVRSLITEYHALLLETGPKPEWGDPQTIWPSGCPWDFTPATDEFLRLLQAAAPLADQLSHKTARRSFENSLDDLSAWRPGAALTGKTAAFFIEKLLPLLPGLEAGQAALQYSRQTIPLHGEPAKAAARILKALVTSALSRHLARARGIFAFVQTFEALHHGEIRASGGLAFADLPALLDPRRFTQRAILDYRLDGAFDHWLLDEFQDTSRPQWRVLQNLADEAIQSDDGRRAFFAVGDVKQAIYGFRGGDAGLFQRILDRYNQPGSPPRIIERRLDTTYRLAPPLVDAVNALFDPAALPPGLPDQTRQHWRQIWSPHRSGRPDLTGFASVAFFDKKAAPDDEAAFDDAEDDDDPSAPPAPAPLRQAVLDRLITLQPWTRGLSCALLVRTNKDAREWADLLRRHGIPCTGEGADSPAFDNDLGAAVRALVRLASHPGDTAAFEFLRMTPLASLPGPDRLAASAALRNTLRSLGFEPAIRSWLSPLRPALDAFNTQRLDDLLAAAAAFDASGTADPDAFLEWLDDLETPSRAAPGTVGVMTIHKSKGLEFDVVFVPVVPSRNRGPKGGDLFVIRNPDGDPTAVLELPRRDFVIADPALQSLRLRSQAETAGEMLRLLYVALTRARRELQVLVQKTSAAKEQKPDTNPILDAAGFLNGILRPKDQPWEYGEPSWFTALPAHSPPAPSPAPPPATAAARPPVNTARLRPRLRRVSPSAAAHPEAALETVNWHDTSDAGVTLGLRVHELFSQLEWLDAPPDNPEALPFAPAGHDDLPARLVFACLRNPAIFNLVFRRPETPCRLLREAAFEWIAPKKSGPGEWMTGVFDRALIRCGPDGRALSALILDFKTDTATPGEIAGRYAAQLRGYRDALAAIEGLPPAAVELALIHVRSQTLVPLS